MDDEAMVWAAQHPRGRTPPRLEGAELHEQVRVVAAGGWCVPDYSWMHYFAIGDLKLHIHYEWEGQDFCSVYLHGAGLSKASAASSGQPFDVEVLVGEMAFTPQGSDYGVRRAVTTTEHLRPLADCPLYTDRAWDSAWMDGLQTWGEVLSMWVCPDNESEYPARALGRTMRRNAKGGEPARSDKLMLVFDGRSHQVWPAGSVPDDERFKMDEVLLAPPGKDLS